MSDGQVYWQRLQEIVQAALDRPVEQRAALLDDACDGDQNLRREAASLLEQDERASAFLATPLAVLVAGNVTYSPGGTAVAAASRDLTGARLGDHEIRSRLGAGGMGEVYRARDHALHRDVAIKVLPAVFATDAERLTRFEREARLLASLNHPHIGAVYGIAGSGTLRGIVLELIEGETLEARLARGPIPLAPGMTLALQIAQALDHAHQHGVMHRDLKPANIMLTKSGAKLLDFGLAKWSEPQVGYAPSTGSNAARPEGVESVTSEGTILGTLQYMAPEQLEGKKVDGRADVFAFGAVLYEMLAGRRAFDGGSAAAVMAAVLNSEPVALDSINRLASPALARLVRKCLAKDPDNRWQTVRDLADELKWIADENRPAAPSMANPGPRRTGMNRWATLGGAAFALLLVGWIGWRIGTASTSPPPRPIVNFPILPSVPGDIIAFDVSADGTSLVYAMDRRMYLRRFDELNDVPVPGTDGADEVAFSPDGQWVAFFSSTRLMKVNIKTMAAPLLLWDLSRPSMNRSTAWIDGDTIVTSTVDGKGLLLVPAVGGEPIALTTFTALDFDHHSPLLLPGGKALIFTVHQKNGDFNIVAQAFSAQEKKAVGERIPLLRGFDPQYVQTGHLVFARDQTILAVPFDVSRLQVTGPEVTLVRNTTGTARDGNGGYRVSKTGTLVFRPKRPVAGRRFVWVDRDGTETPGPLGAGPFTSPSISPDGERFAYAQEDGDSGRRDIWTYEFATEKVTRITQEGDNRTPIWSPDSRRLTYSSTDSTGNTPRGLFSRNAGSPQQVVVSGNLSLVPGAWLSGGKTLLYSDGSSLSGTDHMYSVAADSDPKPLPLLHAPGGQLAPSVSPDGRWIAYTSDETQRMEIHVSNYPGLSERHQVSIDGGRTAKWSSDGREIVFRSFGRVFGVSIDDSRGFSSGKPRVLFEGDFVRGFTDDSLGHDYDLAPDGRFLLMKPGPGELAPVGFRVTLNWVDELARRVPSGQ